MKKLRNSGLSVLIIIALFLFSNVKSQTSLDYITTIKQGVKSKRISSYDPTGGNNDRFENIMPGEIRTIAGMEVNTLRSKLPLALSSDRDETYPWASLPLAASPVKGNALVSYFKMPFANGARIEIENQTDVNIGAFYFYIDYQELTEAASEGKNEWGVLASEIGKNPKGEKNYTILNTEGKGHYVGVNYFVNSPTPIWYGEGDNMFFIDGAEYPTLHGTGTEDYFNSSWCPNERYEHAYFGYALVPDDIGWLGRTHACDQLH